MMYEAYLFGLALIKHNIGIDNDHVPRFENSIGCELRNSRYLRWGLKAKTVQLWSHLCYPSAVG